MKLWARRKDGTWAAVSALYERPAVQGPRVIPSWAISFGTAAPMPSALVNLGTPITGVGYGGPPCTADNPYPCFVPAAHLFHPFPVPAVPPGRPANFHDLILSLWGLHKVCERALQ